MSSGAISEMVLRNRLVFFLLLLICFFISIIIWEKLKSKKRELPERWALPERREDFSYNEDLPEWIRRTAREDLDWGFGVGHFPEFPIDDEEIERGDYTGLTPQRRVKTLMTLEILAASIVLLLILAIIIGIFQ